MRIFLLKRIEDISGVSGRGIVAEGIQFSTGICVLMWTTKLKSVAIYNSIEELEEIHSHGGKTIVIWLNDRPIPHLSCLQCLTKAAVDRFTL